jgi:hemerythrin-like domain-containing protein
LRHVKQSRATGAYAGATMNANAPTLPAAPAGRDGFEVLDAVHRRTLQALDALAMLLPRLESGEIDATARALAREVVQHFKNVSRAHHEDEERHVFPALARSADPEIVQAVLRLQQDHDWLEEDWMELAPHLEAVALGQPWFDLDVLREGAAVFAALSQDHIALEETLIYPQARARLGEAQRAAMGREMAARRRAGRGQRVARGSGAG